MSWILLLRNKWTWYALAGFAIFILSAVMIYNYGVDRYNKGVYAERAAWVKIIERAEARADAAEARVREIQTRLDQESSALRAERREDLREVQEEIRNAETIEEQFAAYRTHRERVLDTANDHLDRARADYLSSIGVGGTGGSA